MEENSKGLTRKVAPVKTPGRNGGAAMGKSVVAPKHLTNTYDWVNLLGVQDSIKCVPVSSFRHVPVSDVWDENVTIGLKVEVKNTDFVATSTIKALNEFYWIAQVVKIAGYFVLLRYEGFGSDSSKDFWVNIFNSQIHPVGWCASQGKVLIPPKSVEERHGDWKEFLVKRLTGSRTLPEDFNDKLKECLKSRFRIGMRLEVVDKKRISAVRVARVTKIIGGRLHITYEGADEEDGGFWCHQHSPLIHPVGWAQLVGHELKATSEYAHSSLQKSMNNSLDDDDAGWSLFPTVRVRAHHTDLRFAEGMKLEAIDPLNLSTICVATVTKVLRHDYLMIGIDGMMAADGSDWFCYHATSPHIFPVGFCRYNNLELTPPHNYGDFDWAEYLKQTSSIAAPVGLFKKEIPYHEFHEGMLIEAVDLMEPRLICVATVTRVVGRLLRIHFNGWDESYDQWCDCESAELFPAGWCQVVGYPLEPPKDEDPANSSLNSSQNSAIDKRKRNMYKGRGKRKKRNGLNMSISSNGGIEDDEGDEDSNNPSPLTPTLAPKTINDWISPKALTNTQFDPPHTRIKQQNNSHTELSNSSVVVKPSPIPPLVSRNSSARIGDPRTWSVAKVVNYLHENDCGSVSQVFQVNKIDGSKLMSLEQEAIAELLGKRLGPLLKINALIKALKDGKF